MYNIDDLILLLREAIEQGDYEAADLLREDIDEERSI